MSNPIQAEAIRKQAFVARFGERGREDADAYFDYAATVGGISRLLSDKYGCDFKLYYQEDQDDVWDGLEEDISSGYPALDFVASVFDLVETRQFVFEPKLGETNYEIRPSVRNNVFAYPEHRVAFARVPTLVNYGLGTEDLIFAESDEGLRACLQAMQGRQVMERKMNIYTDTKDGLDRSREPISQAVTRDDVIMDEALKTQIFRSIDEFFSKDRAFFQTYEIPYKRGILLYGRPGNGKTTLVKSIAGSVDAPVSYWQITEYTTSESIQEVFAAAVKQAPTVLVIEDIDSMPTSCRSFFLNILDGATSKEGVFLIGTTNYPENIDPALMNRAGRFDRAYEVKLPDEEMRLAYLLRKGLGKLADEEQVAHAARRTEGFSLAQLSELYVSAALQQHYEDQIDLERLISDLRSDLNKGRRGDWLSNAGSGGSGTPYQIGFHSA
ncbi:AAA family ATPase [Cohnella nanjingensis]|uniref:ATP-binding protein n=1 Tax=Cohnella nanjingensis TaxID=1387779 RepID=A0A7X0RZH8_9BACL|nr:ATP-binding protein [Cohnella nanjingensis]MBB6675361.1 ATP-binding protein [Cohnella nanjingensis]